MDEISKAEVEKNVMKERYSMDYSRWNQWQPQDPATLKEVISYACINLQPVTCIFYAPD